MHHDLSIAPYVKPHFTTARYPTPPLSELWSKLLGWFSIARERRGSGRW
jgi:hypothetical protein